MFSQSNYLIASFYDNASGVVCLGNSTYPLTYNTSRDEQSALESDFWIIKNLTGDQYTFQNASTGQYIKYNNLITDRSALQLVDQIQSDQSTSFTLEKVEKNGLAYYIIHSVVNTQKIWDRRTSLFSSVYPVGVYSGSGSNNELFIFYDRSGNSVKDDGKIAVSLPKANRTLGAFDAYLSEFKLNNKVPVADNLKKEFFMSIPEDSMGNDMAVKIEFHLKNSIYTFFANGLKIDSGNSVQMSGISNTSKIKLELKNGTSTLASATVNFSCLPLVQLYSDQTIGSVYSLGRIAVTDPGTTDSTEVILTNVKTRGGISLYYDKKSFAINLRDSFGSESDDRSFFGLRNDNNWILDAMYIDPARMRNRVSTDIWNEFATKPYWFAQEPKMRNGTRGRFVELFVNDAYQGLYCMTEKIDRKQLNLKKLKQTTDSISGITTTVQRGGLYKATNWSTAVLMGYPYSGSTYPAFNNTSLSWSGYECKYPELDEGEPIQWNALYNAVKIPSSYYTADYLFTLGVKEVFDLPVYLDYYLFIELMLSTDNHGKNTYSSIYDQSVSNKISISPWDMDATWGIRWDGSKNLPLPEQNFDNYLINYEHGQVNMFLRLKSLDVDNWKSIQLKERYRNLRATAFNKDSLILKFRKYADLFTLSGADTREIAKWSSHGIVSDIQSEMNYLSNWMDKRLAYLDMQYLGAPYTDLNRIEHSFECVYNPVSESLEISGIQSGDFIEIISLQGMRILSLHSKSESNVLDVSEMPSGVYLVRVGGKARKFIKN